MCGCVCVFVGEIAMVSGLSFLVGDCEGDVAAAVCDKLLARLSFRFELCPNQSISDSGRSTFTLDFATLLGFARPYEEERGGMALGEAKGEVDAGGVGGVGTEVLLAAAPDSRDMSMY